MADKEISALTAGTALGGTEVFHGQQGGNSRKFTATQLNAGVGTSFPGSPATNDRFYRTDRAIEYFYDGTRHLSTQLFTIQIPIQPLLVPATATGEYYANNPWFGEYDIYVLRGKVSSLITAGTTSANYFTFQFKTWESVATNLGSALSSQNDTNNIFVGRDVAINALVASTVEALALTFTEVGTTTVYPLGTLQYRLVG